MAHLRSAGRKIRTENIYKPLVYDLHNWVIASGATCHMTLYKNDFIYDTETSDLKVVEVADRYTVPAKLSGTVMIHT